MALTVDEYLEQFPEGIEAHPKCVVKASIVRTIADPLPIDLIQKAVGDRLDVKRVLTAPSSSWVSEVHATAIYLGCRHAAFESDEAFVDDAYEKNRKILSSPLYKGLKFIFTKERIIKMGSKAFALMHRGLVLNMVASEANAEDGSDWELVGPPHLVPPLLVRCYATGLVCAAEIAGLNQCVSAVEVISASVFRVRLRPLAVDDRNAIAK